MLRVGKLALFVMGLVASGSAQTSELHGAQLALQVSTELEIRVIEPPRWEKGCLVLAIVRSNLTSTPLWLPDSGLYIDMPVTKLTNKKGPGNGTTWINVFGITDLIGYEATPLAAGATRLDQLCLPATAAVVNRDKKTRRQLKVAGKLQIEALFFLSEQDYMNNRNQREKMFKMSEAERKGIMVLYPERNLLEIDVPCQEQESYCACEAPPLLLPGERWIVPDVYEFHPDWNERGKRINDKLNRRSAKCASKEPRAEILPRSTLCQAVCNRTHMSACRQEQ